ncbi:VOC family protein [Paenibacillus profundus]|uniref:VOC family protein n=1 Tax=Paenibacillus profundus TaxID=1173085 RepID=A0ABS8YGL4_9BACL|nr:MULTISPECIES: VOC family protein [Paenibacillus]MCE5171123.1 VOC family protein [Paenibacillus profundus]
MSFSYSGIHHVQLAAPANCEDTARHFYGHVLCMTEIEKPSNLKKRGGVWFVCGSQQVHIGVQEPFVPAKKAHPAFEVKGLRALREHVLANTIGIVEDEPLEGYHRFYLLDPFGNRLEFLERA